MYSIEPIANLANNHTGFFFAVGIAVILLNFLYNDIKYNGLCPFTVTLSAVTVLFVLISGLISYAPANNIPPKNEKVVAKFLRFVPQQTTYGCGKNNRDTCFSNLVYGEFQLKDNSTVLLRVNSAHPMPSHVILYRN